MIFFVEKIKKGYNIKITNKNMLTKVMFFYNIINHITTLLQRDADIAAFEESV